MVDFSLQNENQFNSQKPWMNKDQKYTLWNALHFIPFALQTQSGCQRIRKNEKMRDTLLLLHTQVWIHGFQ